MEQLTQQLTGFVSGLITATILFLCIILWIIRRNILQKHMKEEEMIRTRLNLESVRTRMEEKDLSIVKMEGMIQDKEDAIASLQKELTDITGQAQRLEAEIELISESREKERKTLEDSFKVQLELLKEHISNLSDSTLKTTSSQLKADNEESMQKILAPIKAQYDELQKSITSANELNSRNTSSLGEQLLEFGRRADKMDDTARKLTLALKGSSQQMGSWGEMVLKQLLDAQGLQQGRDYDMQSVITDDKGNILRNNENKGMRPDVILHYPQSQDVFIDSKVSIKDYYDYVNETDLDRKKEAMKRHVASLRKHYQELARKDYSSYMAKGRTSIDFVIMFVPNDSALIEAMTYDTSLWTEAFAKKVFITGTQNLFAILKMIEIAWQHYDQTENMKRIISSATEMIQRIGLLSKRIDKFEDDYNAIAKDVREIRTSMHGSKGVLRKAVELKELGISEDKNNPIAIRESDDD